MLWDDLLAEYRALGGIAENVCVRTGSRGRGIFLIDSARPARLHTPLALNVPVPSIELRDGALTTSSPALGTRERAFFEAYERHFGWGAGGRNESLDELRRWYDLPEALRALIRSTAGANDLAGRFAEPTEHASFGHYLQMRKFELPGGEFIVPMIDLVNHGGTTPYGFKDGYFVEGAFDDEMLVSYNSSDPWGIAISHGFPAASPFAYSICLSSALPDGRTLSVARLYDVTTVGNQMQLPRVDDHGEALVLSFLLLGFAPAPDLPRAIFRKLLARHLPAHEIDRVFDGIAHYNRQYFLRVLRAARTCNGALPRALEDAAIEQLETLSACIGARTL
jgi:hypothetical protein